MNLAEKQSLMPTIENPVDTFDEVNCGYDFQLAMLEADRCLNCKHQPCVSACPLHVPIPQFIQLIKANKLEEAYDVITSKSNFPSFCSRVCHVESQCESICVRGIKHQAVGINHLERFVCDHNTHRKLIKQSQSNKKVAIVGAGVSGMAAAADLAQKGYHVDLFDKESTMGGIVAYGVPNYRLPKSVLDHEQQKLLDLGVNFFPNHRLGVNVHLAQLRQDYDAVYLALGEEKPTHQSFNNDHLANIIYSDQFLRQVYEHKAPDLTGKKVVVIGGGNTAMDCARSAVRLKGDVTICYRRSEAAMPASKLERYEAYLEGVKFDCLSQLKEAKGTTEIEQIVCLRKEVVGLDEQNREKSVVIENSEYTLDCNLLIMAIGSTPDKEFRANTLNLKLNQWGLVMVDDYYQTNLPGVFAGGDMVLGADTVVRAVDMGKKAAQAIFEYCED